MTRQQPCAQSTFVGIILVVSMQILVLDFLVNEEHSKISKPLPHEDGKIKVSIILPRHESNRDQILHQVEKWRPIGPPCLSMDQQSSPYSREVVELVLYMSSFPQSAHQELILAVRDKLGEYSRCFAQLRVVTANLTAEEDVYPAGPSIMFFRLFDDRKLTAQFISTTHIFWMEHDVLPLREGWADVLLREASNGKFWISGSVYKGRGLDLAAAVSGNKDWVGHINGNALYDYKDEAFRQFLILVQQYEPPQHIWKPFDVSIWKVLHAFPYTWSVYQKYRGKFRYSDFIDNWGFHISSEDYRHSQARKGVYLLHGSNSSAGSRPKPGYDVEWSDRVPKSLKLSILIISSAVRSSFCHEAAMSAIKFVPNMLELVIVVPGSDFQLFKHQFGNTSFNRLRIIKQAPVLRNRTWLAKLSRLQAEIFCRGELILFMDDDTVFNQDLRVRDLLWVNKPILAYQRYESTWNLNAAENIAQAQNAVSHALGFPVQHRFAHIPCHIYPRQVFAGARDHIATLHNVTLPQFFARLRQDSDSEASGSEHAALLDVFDLLGAYSLQHHRHAFALTPFDADEKRQLLLPPPLIQRAPLCRADVGRLTSANISRAKLLRNLKYTWKFKLSCHRLPGLRDIWA